MLVTELLYKWGMADTSHSLYASFLQFFVLILSTADREQFLSIVASEGVGAVLSLHAFVLERVSPRSGSKVDVCMFRAIAWSCSVRSFALFSFHCV